MTAVLVSTFRRILDDAVRDRLKAGDNAADIYADLAGAVNDIEGLLRYGEAFEQGVLVKRTFTLGINKEE